MTLEIGEGCCAAGGRSGVPPVTEVRFVSSEKVGGIYVSPIEVEEALSSHGDVIEAAVVGARDGDDLVKPPAYVVLSRGAGPVRKPKRR